MLQRYAVKTDSLVGTYDTYVLFCSIGVQKYTDTGAWYYRAGSEDVLELVNNTKQYQYADI